MGRKFTKDHEWITVDGDLGTVGISDYAQQQLGDVVYVTLTKDIGETISKGDDAAEIESVKSVSQVFSPVSGEITEFNTAFDDEANSELINKDPYNAGWIFKIKLSDPAELNDLMDEDAYNAFIAQ